MFTHYKSMCKELAMVSYEIAHFTGISQEDIIEALTFIRFDGDRIQFSGIQRRTEMIALNSKEIAVNENHEWLDYLLKRYEYLDDEISFFEFCIRQMGEKKSDIIFELLDGDLTWDQIANAYYISRSMVAVYRKEAIKELNRCYEMRDEMRAKYEEWRQNKE